MVKLSLSVVLLCLLVFCVLINTTSAQYSYTYATTQYGELIGLSLLNASVFLGIPYAAPPINDLRFKAPVAAPSWGNRSAVAFGPQCAQIKSTGIAGSEDCLYLNVFVPNRALPKSPSYANVSLPVMVWIHGGGYLTGASDDYNAFNLIVSTQNVLVVTINYRLNIFGFLTHPDLIAENPELNYGLQDQQFALKWVKENIASFGGDPSKVTIFGESAGGGSCSFHLLMPKSFPYYSRAIIESPGFWIYPTLSQASQTGIKIFQDSVCGNLTGSSFLSCIRNTSLLATANLLTLFNSEGQNIRVVVDEQQVKDQPTQLYLEHRFNRDVTAVMIGTNAVEGHAFVTIPNVDRNVYQVYAGAYFNYFNLTSTVSAWYENYSVNGNYYNAISNAIADYGIDCGVVFFSDEVSQHTSVPVYRYMFNQSMVNTFFAAAGPTHTAEINYVFNLPNIALNGTWAPLDLQLSTAMYTYWTNFAVHGDPNNQNGNPVVISDLPEWKPFKGSNTGTNTLFLLQTPGFGYLDEWKSNQCAPWKAIMASKPIASSSSSQPNNDEDTNSVDVADTNNDDGTDGDVASTLHSFLF